MNHPTCLDRQVPSLRSKLRRIILLPMLAVMLILLGVIIFGALVVGNAMIERQQLIVHGIARQGTLYLEETGKLMRSLAYAMRGFLPAQQQELLARIRENYPRFNALYLVNSSGKVVAEHTDALKLLGLDMSEERFFHANRDAETLYFSEPFISLATHQITVTMAASIVIEDHFAGMLVGELNLEWLQQIIAQVPQGMTNRTFITDQRGKLVAHPEQSWVQEQRNLGDLPLIQSGVAGKDAVKIFYDRDLNAWLFGSITPMAWGWLVATTQPVSVAARPLFLVVLISLAAYGVSLLIFLWVQVRNLRQIIRPITLLTQQANRLANEEYDREHPDTLCLLSQESAFAEILSLNHSFIHMAEAVAERTSALKIANSALKKELRERQRIEEALRENEEFLHNIVENIPNMIFVKDAQQLRFVRFNKAGEALLGYSRQELIGKSDYDLFPKHEADFFVKYDRIVLEQRMLQDIPEETIQTRNLAQRILHTKKIPILDQEGKPLYLLGISEDITARRHAEAALQESENRFATFMDYLPANVTIKDQESRFLYANKQMSSLFETERWGGKTAREYFPPQIAERVILTDRQAIEHGPMIFEEAVPIKTGEIRMFETRKFPIKQQGRPDLIGIISLDITERKRAEEGIRRLNAELEERVRDRTAQLETANKELESFAYVVSHDLKAPLRAISRLVKWLVEDYDGVFDAEGREMVDLLVSRVKRMDEMIDGILKYSRSGRMIGQRESVDLNQVVPEIIDSLSPPPGIQVSIASVLPVISADIIRIQQIFTNLINNAVKFIDNPRGTIMIRCEESDEDWRFSVADNGPGIDPKYHDKIFQIFQTLQARDEFESTGIGLSIVKKIVELYGGRIWVESEVGKGSTFFFTFPKQESRL